MIFIAQCSVIFTMLYTIYSEKHWHVIYDELPDIYSSIPIYIERERGIDPSQR